MAFAVVCKSCQARFLLNDDLLRRKVAGRVVTVRCRQCHATIEVDASDLDPKAVAGVEKAAKPAPAAEPPKPPLKIAKPAPAPPRPTARSTLMGIGAPRPGGATELVALSPGLLNMTPRAPAPAPIGQRGFPEPPLPPGVTEELSPDDWEVTQTPMLAKAEPAPESVDDFVEELPPSLPPPAADEPPSSTDTPSLESLAHLGERTPEPAPTASRDSAAFDVPAPGKQTLPLFALSSDDAPVAPAAPLPPKRRAADAGGDGSLSPAAVERPVGADAPDSLRERKNVIAPATKSVPPSSAAARRSGLAAPILLALTLAAGFLIWKRNAVYDGPSAHSEPLSPRAAELPAPVAATPTPTEAPSEPTPAASVAPPTAEEELTFETTPSKPAPLAQTGQEKSPQAAPAVAEKPAAEKPAAEKPVTSKPEPEKPPAHAEPAAPSTPGEPAGPFDRAAAAAALNSGAAQASSCRKEGDPSGVASVVITFAPSGRVTSANISGPPFAGTPTGGCIAAALRKARVPAFEGDRVTVSKTIVIQ